MVCSRLLLIAACIAVASARPMGPADELTSPQRSLQQTAFCPDGCLPGNCIQDATKGGLRCQKCQGTLVVNKVTGECACPMGYYIKDLAGDPYKCADCPKGSYCPGDIYNPTGQNGTPQKIPVANACPSNMTTVGQRSTSLRACVNTQGFYYVIDATGQNVTQVPCPVNTYGPGLKKQRACVPCPTGFTTNLRTQQSTPTACIVPAGYYLKGPGQIAPCPKGEWKSGVGPNGNCTKCAFGVTTLNEASTAESECMILVSGYYAVAISNGIVTSTQICPQGYYCPGGAPTAAFNPAASPPGPLTTSKVEKCPNGQWTVDLGSIAPEQCLTPPGYFTSGTTTQKCAGGTYRPNWKTGAEAAACLSCGDGVKTDATDRVAVYDILNPANMTYDKITTSSDDCYIQPGQGLYYSTLTQSWRAKNCDENSYGVNNRTYGLSPAACRDCPDGQVAKRGDALYPVSNSFYMDNGDGTGGFISAKACVNKPGFGYNGRVSQKCEKGAYNAPDTYGLCTACPYGTTTTDVGAGVYLSDCGVAPGFGKYNSSYLPCPVGTFNAAPWTNTSTAGACSECPGYTTTQDAGADSAAACTMCDPGYGGSGFCATQCGGLGANATYGTMGREVNTTCAPCSTQNTGFSFEWMMENQVWSAAAISRPAANVSGDCLSQFSQTVDGAWYLPLVNGYAASGPGSAKVGTMDSVTGLVATDDANKVVNEVVNVTDWQACVNKCTSDCMFVTYDYRTKGCAIRYAKGPVYVGAPLVAFKAVPSGDVAASSLKSGVSVMSGAVASGQYTFWRDEFTLEYKNQAAAPGAAGFTTLQQCLNACDDDVKCSGIIIDIYVNSAMTPTSCKLIKGDETVGVFKRTVVRADVDRLVKPAL